MKILVNFSATKLKVVPVDTITCQYYMIESEVEPKIPDLKNATEFMLKITENIVLEESQKISGFHRWNLNIFQNAVYALK